jgi:serine/threonine-protein kinase
VAIDERARTLAAAEPTPSAERQILGARYELLGLLGSGGMGNVYKARDVELDEIVALKVLLPQLVSAPGALDRFRREVKLARRVTHPNVARVFDIGELGGERILTMELVDGESLGACLHREGRLSLVRAVDIARAICAGVGAAHAAGVVHRDLKPDNVLLEKTGRVVVTDFGIARAAAEGARTVGVVGTPAYMAPEQIDERATIDHRADVYALGAVLYEMIVGEPAWRGESVWALAAARLVSPPPDPREKRPEIPDALAEIVLRAMARDPAQRTAAMADVDHALGALALPLPSSRAPTPLPSPRVAEGLATTGSDKRVAVLPFQSPAEQRYVADGLTEELIDALSMSRGLRVRSRGAVMAFEGTTRDSREIGRELDVHVVVEGSVRKTEAGFRITARLVSVADGFQLWARRFDVSEAALLAQNDAIAAAVAEALSVDVATPARAPAADGAAVDLYLRARNAYARSFSGDILEPVRLYEQLIALTPDDPRALSGHVLAMTHQWAWAPGMKERVLAATERAIKLAPTLPDGHAARGCLHLFAGEGLAAVAPLRAALRISSSSVEAQEAMGRVLIESDCEDGVAHIELAHALEPLYEFPYIPLIAWYEERGERERVDELLAEADARGLKLSDRMWPRLILWRGDRARAQRMLAQVDPTSLVGAMSVGWLKATLGEASPPMSLPPGPPGTEMPVFLQWFVLETTMEIAAALGEPTRALEALRRLDALGTHRTAYVERCPALAPLRAMPESDAPRASIAARARAIVAAYRG